MDLLTEELSRQQSIGIRLIREPPTAVDLLLFPGAFVTVQEHIPTLEDQQVSGLQLLLTQHYMKTQKKHTGGGWTIAIVDYLAEVESGIMEIQLDALGINVYWWSFLQPRPTFGGEQV